MKRKRIPFSIGEEILEFADRPDEPLNIWIEVRVAGTLDESRLRDAIARACAVHPMTRVRKASGRFLLRPPQWALAEAACADALDVADCANDTALAAARAAVFARRLPVRSAPALRFLLARRPRGDSLVLSAKHAIMDGFGGLRLLRSVGRAYAGAADPVPPVDPLRARQLREQFGGKTPAPGAKAERLRPMPGEPTFVAPAAESQGSAYGVCNIAVPADRRRRLKPHRFGPAATHNDMVLAALHRAIACWNTARSEPVDGISVLVPVNRRPREWYNEVVGNLVMSGEVISTPESRTSVEALMAAVVAQTQAIKTGDRFAAILALPGWVYRQIPLILLALSKLTGNRGRSAAVLSYFGRVDREVPDFGPEAGPVTEIWGAPPAARPMAVALGCGWFQGKLCVSLRYRRAVLDDAAARQFASLFLEVLFALGDGTPFDLPAAAHELPDPQEPSFLMCDEMNYV